MENINDDSTFNLYNVINKYYVNKLLISFIVSFFVIVAIAYYYLKPLTYSSNIEIAEVANFDFTMDEQLSRYFKVNNIKSELFLQNFITKINNFSLYEKLALEIKAESDNTKLVSFRELDKYDIAKYIFDRVNYEKIEGDFTAKAYNLSYTDREVNVDEIIDILKKLVSLTIREDIHDLRKNIKKEINIFEYEIKIMRRNHENKIKKLERDLKQKIHMEVIKLNYTNSIKIRNLKEQIQIAKNVGFIESQIEVIDLTNELAQNEFFGKSPTDQILNLPLYFFGRIKIS